MRPEIGLRVVGVDRREAPKRIALLVLAVLLVSCLFVLAVFTVHGLASLLIQRDGPLSTAARLQAANDARASVIQLLAGFGLLGGLIYTIRTFLLTRRTQRTDRFSRAVEQLGSESETVRSGAVYSLWLLARETDAYWPVVDAMLTALIRERACEAIAVASDVQAALNVLGQRRPRRSAERRGPVDLSGVHLPNVRLVGADFERTDFRGAHLDGALFQDARLRRANFAGASLVGANLSNADLTEADFRGARLQQAVMYLATVKNTDFGEADTEHVIDQTDESGDRHVSLPS